MTKRNVDAAAHLASPDAAMEAVLDEMLAADETITARAAARRHPQISSASSITRDPVRSALLARYKELQLRVRKSALATRRRSGDDVTLRLAQN